MASELITCKRVNHLLKDFYSEAFLASNEKQMAVTCDFHATERVLSNKFNPRGIWAVTRMNVVWTHAFCHNLLRVKTEKCPSSLSVPGDRAKALLWVQVGFVTRSRIMKLNVSEGTTAERMFFQHDMAHDSNSNCGCWMCLQCLLSSLIKSLKPSERVKDTNCVCVRVCVWEGLYEENRVTQGEMQGDLMT